MTLGCLLASAISLPLLAQVPTPQRKTDQPMPDAKLASYPNFILDPKYKDRVAHPLPRTVDNSKQPFFPPIATWRQQGSSCANAQSVSVVYSYEAQRLRGLRSTGATPEYTYEYTYHFLNEGTSNQGDGWMFVEAWDILKETGAPTSVDFGGLEWGNGFAGWMSGYDKYYRAMKYPVERTYKIDASVPAGDEIIKQYLHDRGEGAEMGGNLVVQIRSTGWVKTTVGGRNVISSFGKGILNHALTICGYDDSFNGGSWLVHNTHGDGLYWAPYSLFRAGGNVATTQGTPVMFPKLKKDYAPKYTFKITLTHNLRGSIAIMTGAAPSAGATVATRNKDYAGAFNFSGGAFPLEGKAQSATLEIGLDLTDFADLVSGKDARFFLHVISKGGVGTIDKVSLMDYTGPTVREILSTEFKRPIAANATTTLSIPLNGISAIRNLQILSGGFRGQSLLGYRSGGPVRISLAGGPATGAVLSIRDIHGRPVFGGSMDLDGTRGPGSRVFPWGMDNLRGELVAPGLYFASLKLLGGQAPVQEATALIRVLD